MQTVSLRENQIIYRLDFSIEKLSCVLKGVVNVKRAAQVLDLLVILGLISLVENPGRQERGMLSLGATLVNLNLFLHLFTIDRVAPL